MNKQTVLYLHNGMLLTDKNEWTINTENKDEFQNNYAKWKK